MGHVQGKGCLEVGADLGFVELNGYAFREGAHFIKNKYKFAHTKLSITKCLFGMKKINCNRFQNIKAKKDHKHYKLK